MKVMILPFSKNDIFNSLLLFSPKYICHFFKRKLIPYLSLPGNLSGVPSVLNHFICDECVMCCFVLMKIYYPELDLFSKN